MEASSPSPFTTPKRKRIDIAREDFVPSLPSLNTHFSFDVAQGLLPDGGGGSPRTNVAHRFRGLALGDSNTCGSGGGVVALADGVVGEQQQHHSGTDTVMMDIDGDESKMRKRTRLSPMPAFSAPQQPAHQTEIPETPHAPDGQQDASAELSHHQPRFAPIDQHNAPLKANTCRAHGTPDPALFTASPNVSPNKILKPYHTANNRPVEALKPRSRRRAGTPPLVAATTKAGNVDQSGDPGAEIIDPVRAALTWHDNEITVYDPEDEDDDGTGINGIGFKPTPAIAYARTMKRKQQLAEYKKREEREARARRSSRRRGSPERATPKLERKPSVRKVRFTEKDAATMITI
ncbi:hypothetical protein VSDG_05311 [Cytospora chrysosperma]|uniref:Uncharacterized protein n=1 Tax=Cytospora chrysosperma TaxID=252740 RepID=A0A423VX13_CYTCH|nr:hypothetical protein VSDG_05311 [Valsa sordida]